MEYLENGGESEGNTPTTEQRVQPCREEAGSEEVSITGPENRVRGLWRAAANRTIKETEKSSSTCGDEDNSYHQVWRPKKQPRLADLVTSLGNLQEKQKVNRRALALHPPVCNTLSNTSLRSRQQMLQDRIQVTQAVLTDEILSEERTTKPRMSFKEASKRITMNIQKQKQEKKGKMNLSDIVTLYMAKRKAEETSKSASSSGVSKAYQTHHGKSRLHKRHNTRGIFDSSKLGAIPVDKWQKLIGDSKTSFSTIDGGYKLETEV